jgi:16S rRNA (cytidine1402-2'-O)-methyltransferase
MSFHEHNSRGRIPQILERLTSGAHIALVSDAGTPGISDPGVALVRSCRAQGLAVEPLPGACAPIVAAVASGFSLNMLTFLGFAPSRSVDRKRWLERLAKLGTTTVFFESPHRARRMLEDIRDLLGNRQIFVAREMTKLHGEFVAGDAAALLPKLVNTRGELTFVLGPVEHDGALVLEGTLPGPEAEALSQMTNNATGKRAEIARVARKHGRSTNQVYRALEQQRRGRQ